MINRCIICGCEDYKIAYDKIRKDIMNNCLVADTETSDDIKVIKCSNCGLLRLNTIIDDIESFYEESGMWDYSMHSLDEIRHRWSQDNIRQFNETKSIVDGKDVLDFGCGAGGYLSKIKDIAKTVQGVELENNMRHSLNRGGIKCFRTLNDSGKYDVITMFHVLAHIVQPIEILQECKNHLSQKGIIYIETPNANDALLSLYENQAFMGFTHHKDIIWYFSENTIRELLNKAGFNNITIGYTQRYPLANHLYWLAKGKPGGQDKWVNMRDEMVDSAYSNLLIRNKMADTLTVTIEVS